MNEEILNKADLEVIRLVKNESEKLFNSIIDVDNILTNKSSNLLNVCVSILTVSIGFSISQLLTNTFSNLIVYSIFVSILLMVVVFKLIQNISPISTTLIGSDKLIIKELISGSKHDEYLILTNRILNIQDGIKSNKDVAERKAKEYKESYKLLITGLTSISVLFLLFCLFLNLY
jgi:hypothetical protein